MRCRSVLTRVDALRTGELPPEEQTVVHEHLKTCSSCDESLDDVGTLAKSVKALIATPPRSCRESMSDSYERIDDVWVAFTRDGLRMIRRGGTFNEFLLDYTKRYGRSLQGGKLPDPLRKQVVAALGGEGVEKPRVDWSDEISPLEREVLGVLTRIPRGEVRTYEWVARQVGRPRAVRAVGTICARNVVPLVVPCHRVVPTTGGVGQYAFGPAMKRELLQREGVDVQALDELAKKGVRYIGSRTTKIVCLPTCRDAKRIREENRVPFRAAGEAVEKGFRPCLHCQPFVAA
ncbi:MAG TPA: methylated-DNA--[protein]-cysteine S-methyltransferase [Thermoanaerobaculia bacterium]|nr:methylated-DNA--[protein]-cysteine S-methyltransferase [Thermoanaerobaculia bacterium]